VAFGRHDAEARRGRNDSGSAVTGVHQINWNGKPGDGQLLAFIDAQVQAHDARHIHWVQRAKVQLAWAAGDQNSVIDEVSGDLGPSDDVQADQIALNVNKIKPAVLNWISMVTSRPITFRVTPATPDNEDVAAAGVQDKLAKYYWNRLLEGENFLNSLWIILVTGIGFYQSGWDPNAGGELSVGAEDVLPDSSFESDGRSIVQRVKDLVAELTGRDSGEVEGISDDGQMLVAEGDLDCKLLTGFDIINPARATNIKDAAWLIVREFVSIEDLRIEYGDKAKGIEGGDQDQFGYNQYQGSNYRSQTWHTDGEHAIKYTLWRPRSKACKKGFKCVVCQGRVLESGPNPYEHGEIPVVRITELPSAKEFWPPSTVTDLMSLQAEINITHSQVAEHKARTVDPKIIYEKGAGLDDEAFTRRGELVEVNRGFIDKVKPWVPEPLQSYVAYWMQNLREAFDDIARNHAPSYGKPKGGVRSGKQAIAYQEADARLNAPMMRLLKEGLAEVCRQWMAILHQFGDEARTIRIIGDNNEPEVLTWSKADLPYAKYNVTCDLGPTVDQQTMMDLIDMLTARGWIRPDKPEDKALVFRWMGQGVTHEIDESKVDRRNASMENQRLLKGEEVAISDGDDDTTHLEEHHKEQKSAKYREQMLVNPEIEKIFAVHIREHERRRISKQIRQEVEAQKISMELTALALPAPAPGMGAPSGPGAGGPAAPAPPGPQSQNSSKPPNQGAYVPRQPKNQVQGQRANRAPRLGVQKRPVG